MNTTPERTFHQASETKATAVKANEVAFLSSKALLAGEDPDRYDQLVDAMCEMVKPTDFIEKIWVADVVHLSWEVIRYRNLTTELIGATQQQALERVLRMLISGNLERQPPDGDPFLLMNRSQKLAHEYVLKIEDAAEEVEDLLKTAGLTMESVQAEAFAMRSTDIELLQRLSASAEYRRNSAIQQIERRRSYFAERLRTAVNQIEDAEFRVIEHKSADQRKAA